MLLTTTSTLQDRHIDDYKGVVSGEAILGANAFRDMFAGIRDIVGGRSAAYERELQKAKDLAISEMVERARDTGANAVIGIDLDYETVGQNRSMLMVTASGTAVVVSSRNATDRRGGTREGQHRRHAELQPGSGGQRGLRRRPLWQGVRVERWVVSISAPECQFCASVPG